MAKSSFTAVFSVIDRVTAPMKKLERAFRPFDRAFSKLGNSSRQLTSAFTGIVAPLGAVFGAAGIGSIGGLGAKIITTSAQFEKFQTILETVEGSSAKAKASMDWVSQFATDTPYELAEVTDAFVKLKAYGIDPQAGALMAAGDAAAAMGKPLEQAVEALADVMSGETERMKEFGMKFSTEGDKLVYRYEENGKKMVAMADKNSRAQIEAMVKGLWNSRYAGAGAKLATTWDGLWSNMSDGFTRFFKMIGDAGVFDFMKAQLVGVLDTMNKMAADGSLQQLANTISTELVNAFKELKSWFDDIDWKGVWSDVKGFAKSAKDLFITLGGMKGAAVTLGVVFGVQFLSSVVSLTAGFISLNLALGPIGWALIAIAAAAFVIYDNWGNIANFFTDQFNAIADAFDKGFLQGILRLWQEGNPITLITAAFDGLVKYLSGIELNLKGMFPDWVTGGVEVASPKALPGLGGTDSPQYAGLPKSGLLSSAKQNLTGNLTVSFEGAPPGMKVTSGKTNQPGVAMEADVGYRSLAMP